MNNVMLYENFQPGEKIGQISLINQTKYSQLWKDIFSHSSSENISEAAEANVILAMQMRAYTTVIDKRPPGNIHAKQKLKIISIPHPEETIHTEIYCINKEIRRGHKYVDLGIKGTGYKNRKVYEGVMSVIWAA